MTIEEIEKAEVIGNYHSDAALWRQIDDFILSNAPIEEKKRALKKVNEITGADDPYDDVGLAVYVDWLRQCRGI